jgi:hypothetical protein
MWPPFVFWRGFRQGERKNRVGTSCEKTAEDAVFTIFDENSEKNGKNNDDLM